MAIKSKRIRRRKGNKKSKKSRSRKNRKNRRTISLKRCNFGTEDRRTLHEDGARVYNVSTQFPGGILMAQNAFSWENDPQNRALNAGM